MKRQRLITVIVLGLVLVGITVALLVEAGQGPSFRPDDYGSYRECLANIPAEWGPGSLQRTGAEDACAYVHGAVRR